MPKADGSRTTAERGLGWDYQRIATPMRRQAVGRPCPRCGVVMTKQQGRQPRPSDATVEHRIPRALGGRNTPDNLEVICRDCNIRPGARMGGLMRSRPGRRRPRLVVPVVRGPL